MTAEQRELLELTERLLATIAEGDWDAYAALCDPSLTCFEPECKGQLVEGLAFHRFYFDLGARSRGTTTPALRNTTLAAPSVRIVGDAAIVAYVRLIQKVGADGAPQTLSFEETRVWAKTAAGWKHVHFHRSEPTA